MTRIFVNIVRKENFLELRMSNSILFIYGFMFLIVYYLLMSIQTILKKVSSVWCRVFEDFNFCDSCFFLNDPGKNKFFQIKITANIFAAKI